MTNVEPSVLKSKAYKKLMKELGKPPKVEITPVNFKDREEQKKAKMMQKMVNYMFETNQDGITTKYFKYLNKCQEEFARSMIYGVEVRWDVIERFANLITGNFKPNE